MNKTSHFPADVPAFLCVKCFSQPEGNLLSGTIIERRGPEILMLILYIEILL